jgi:hypothetical protein
MKVLYGALLALLLVLLTFAPVAAIADPDTSPQVNAVLVYTDCLEEGDLGALVEYYLDYAVLPTEIATESYLVVFLDTDGTTQLKATSPYTFVDSGYGAGLVWLYFSADEVTSYGLDVANQSLYRVKLVGNPTIPSGWAGDPPETVGTIDYWQTSGDTATIVALQVLDYADQLEIDWSLDMIETTALGNKLTTVGESYFDNVIPGLRTIAPAAYASTTYEPLYINPEFSTVFGATVTDGTGTVNGSPVTLIEDSQTVTVTGTGTIVVELTECTVGTATDDTGTVTGSPVDLVAGVNTLVVTGAGDITFDMEREDTVSIIDRAIQGTAFDLTTIAAHFGMTRWFFSGIVWLGITILICAAVYKVASPDGYTQGNPGTGKIVLIVFDVCLMGGGLLGLIHPIVAVLLFLAFAAFSGYILFFRGANV